MSRLPLCTELQSSILRRRARGDSYRAISRATRIAPRKVHDAERAALKKVVEYLETAAFLDPTLLERRHAQD